VTTDIRDIFFAAVGLPQENNTPLLYACPGHYELQLDQRLELTEILTLGYRRCWCSPKSSTPLIPITTRKSVHRIVKDQP
jgi:hypothetical protein